MLLFGKYEHQIDEKNRIRIPAKLKDALGANPVIMKGTSPCLVVYSSERASEVIKAKFEKSSTAPLPTKTRWICCAT